MERFEDGVNPAIGADTTDDPWWNDPVRDPETNAVVVRPKYDERVRGVAFQVWWLAAGRNARRTATTLERYLPPGYDGPIPDERTIRRWVREGNWSLMASERMKQAAPDLMDRWVEQMHELVPAAIDIYAGILLRDKTFAKQTGAQTMPQQLTATIVLERSGVLDAMRMVTGDDAHYLRSKQSGKHLDDMSDDELAAWHVEQVTQRA